MKTLLEQYNRHWQRKFTYDLIERHRYSNSLLPLMDRREILVLKGIRRAGKSSLLKLIINHLIQHKRVPPNNIVFINLEDYRLGRDKGLHTLDDLYQSYIEHKQPKGRVYLLLDEIQEIPAFEKWLRTHYEQNEQLKFVITGSSASLFSRELATLLTGRQVSKVVYPFSFLEYLKFKSNRQMSEDLVKSLDMLYLSKCWEKVEPHLLDFLDGGGFPEMIKQEDPTGNILVLQQYINDILLRDIAQRYNLRRIEVLQKLALFLIFNMSNGMNITRIAEQVGSNRSTVMDLIGYMEEVYLLFTSSSFSFSRSEQLASNKARKVYCIDNGFFAAIKTNEKHDFAKKFRNVVFQQLRFHWETEVFYWREKVEVDFILPDGFPIAVASTEAEIDRRITQLFHYMQRHNRPKGLLINWRRLQIIDESEQSILMLPLWMFLLKSRDEILTYSS